MEVRRAQIAVERQRERDFERYRQNMRRYLRLEFSANPDLGGHPSREAAMEAQLAIIAQDRQESIDRFYPPLPEWRMLDDVGFHGR